jgi:hypothetical protein
MLGRKWGESYPSARQSVDVQHPSEQLSLSQIVGVKSPQNSQSGILPVSDTWNLAITVRKVDFRLLQVSADCCVPKTKRLSTIPYIATKPKTVTCPVCAAPPYKPCKTSGNHELRNAVSSDSFAILENTINPISSICSNHRRQANEQITLRTPRWL